MFVSIFTFRSPCFVNEGGHVQGGPDKRLNPCHRKNSTLSSPRPKVTRAFSVNLTMPLTLKQLKPLQTMSGLASALMTTAPDWNSLFESWSRQQVALTPLKPTPLSFKAVHVGKNVIIPNDLFSLHMCLKFLESFILFAPPSAGFECLPVCNGFRICLF